MRTFLVVSWLAALLSAQDGSAPAAFRPMRLFGDHMVLPRSTKVPVAGFGTPGADVAVRGSWGGDGAAKVSTDGRWRCELQTPAAPGPFEVTLRSGESKVVLHDVLVGDVWLGSGQSNMEMPVGDLGAWRGGVNDWQREVASADLPQLRFFTVELRTSGVPLDDVGGVWQICSPATAAACSASAFFFGRELLQRGKGPIGLVVSSWGGTVCEAWASEPCLTAFPEFGAALAATKPATKVKPSDQRSAFWRAVPEQSTGPASEVMLPEVWSKAGLADFDGVMFYERVVALPAALVGKDLAIELGAIDDLDTVWCNGERVGGHEDDGAWSTKRHYVVPAAATKAADGLRLRVRVVDTGGEGGFTGNADELQIVVTGEASQRISLAGGWQRRAGPAMSDLPKWPRGEEGNPNRPAVLWNAMIAPLVPFPFTGALWYQGESNRSRHAQYAKLFPAMITDWRRAFGRELPFYFVQIAPFHYSDKDEITALLREAQAAALSLPHTGMVVTLDIGDAGDIHPRDKQSVGKRLALQALRDHYGEKVTSDGPRAQHAAREGRGLRVRFGGCEGGLAATGGVTGFEIAGADGVFHPATGKLDGDSVLLTSDHVESPQHVRYAWAAVPDATLRNGAGLPAAPFQRTLPAGSH